MSEIDREARECTFNVIQKVDKNKMPFACGSWHYHGFRAGARYGLERGAVLAEEMVAQGRAHEIPLMLRVLAEEREAGAL